MKTFKVPGNFSRKILKLLEALPDEDTDQRTYENAVKDMIMTHASKEMIAELESLLEKTTKKGRISEEEDRIAYNSLAALTTYYRRLKEPDKLDKLWESYGKRFEKNHSSWLQYYLLTYVDRDLQDKWEDIFMRSQENCNSGNPGAYHMSAEFIINYFEQHDDVKWDSPRWGIWMDWAETAMDRALKGESGYPKFHCTNGRLCALLGKFDEAIQEIQRAIDLEKSDDQDYTLRISNYRFHMLYAQNRKQIEKIKKESKEKIEEVEKESKEKIEEVEKESKEKIEEVEKRSKELIAPIQEEYKKLKEEHDKIQESLRKNIEYLGLFAGIVSFIICSISLTGSLLGENPINSTTLCGLGGLIIILFGTLLGVYSCFVFMLHIPKKWDEDHSKIRTLWRENYPIILVFALSCLIVIVGLFLFKGI